MPPSGLFCLTLPDEIDDHHALDKASRCRESPCCATARLLRVALRGRQSRQQRFWDRDHAPEHRILRSTKHAGKNLAPKWRALFEETRKACVRDIAAVAISHRTVRLRALQRMADRAEEKGDASLLMKLLEQAAREVGNAFVGRHNH